MVAPIVADTAVFGVAEGIALGIHACVDREGNTPARRCVPSAAETPAPRACVAAAMVREEHGREWCGFATPLSLAVIPARLTCIPAGGRHMTVDPSGSRGAGDTPLAQTVARFLQSAPPPKAVVSQLAAVSSTPKGGGGSIGRRTSGEEPAPQNDHLVRELTKAIEDVTKVIRGQPRSAETDVS